MPVSFIDSVRFFHFALHIQVWRSTRLAVFCFLSLLRSFEGPQVSRFPSGQDFLCENNGMRPRRFFNLVEMKVKIQGSMRRAMRKVSSMIRSGRHGTERDRPGRQEHNFSRRGSYEQGNAEARQDPMRREKNRSGNRRTAHKNGNERSSGNAGILSMGNSGQQDENPASIMVINNTRAHRVGDNESTIESYALPRLNMIDKYVENELALPFTSRSLKLGVPLGSGAMGDVRIASTSRASLLDHLGGNNVVAVKLVEKGSYHETNLFLEYMMMKDLRGLSGIAQSYGVYCGEAQNGIVMEYLCGTTMHDVIRQTGCPSADLAIKVMKTLFGIIASMHNRNVAHLDLKPENIMFVTTAESRFDIWKALIKIVDFGVAAGGEGGPDIREILPHPLSGTPGFVAPEVLKGLGYRADKADIWSAGVIMYMLLFNKLPYEGETIDAYGDVLWARGERLKYYPAADQFPIAKNVLQRCLRVHAFERPTAEEALALLQSESYI